MYLNEGVPTEVLRLCRESFQGCGDCGSLVFPDALDNIPKDDDEEVARRVLNTIGWKLSDWLPKGGRTRCMGTATMLRN